MCSFPEDIMSRISVIHGKRARACLPATQARLLAQINQGFTDDWWDHYRGLVAKRQGCRLTAAEHRELLRISDQLEKREAKRLQALVKLAKLRKQSLTELMTTLGLPGPADG
jgi:hypothetical protein